MCTPTWYVLHRSSSVPCKLCRSVLASSMLLAWQHKDASSNFEHMECMDGMARAIHFMALLQERVDELPCMQHTDACLS
jgi:hypothetical protein